MKVEWNEKTCQHAGVCVKTLPAVFKIEDGSFVIDPSAASEEEVRDVLAKCPSGALTATD
ncbi:MAG: (4Fe-4S)-binding protein [Gammaproteobacteria bacterium]